MQNKKPTISVSIITFNEERIIYKTLSCVKSWADEIVVVDSFSTDETLNIIKQFNVNLYTKKWEGYSEQRNYALSKCTCDWVLVIDADEIVTDSLKKEIDLILSPNCSKNGFKIKRKFFLGNRWIKHGGYYPDYQLRLFKNNIGAHCSKRAIHESYNVPGEIRILNNPLEHYAYNDLNSYEMSLKKYAELASKEIKNKQFYIPTLRAFWSFLYRYFFRLGLLEGELGYKLTKIYSNYVYQKYDLAKNG